VEFIHVVSRERFRRNLSDDLQRQLRVRRWNEPLVRQAYIRSFVRRLEAVLTQFTWIEIDLTPEIRRRAFDYIAQYNLSGQDAIHLARALNAGVTDLASFDGGFRRVEGVHLWNDLIHAK
jgi:predicted nucleic acid-binding protein